MKYIIYIASLMLLPVQASAQADSILTQNDNTIEYGKNVSVDLKESTTATAFTTQKALSHRKGINPTDVLYGLIPGLQVSQNQGTSWDTYGALNVRGQNTLNAKKPLVLVDGFERDLGQISVDEIEKITVLKDAPSTALYGMRGANGVILVTTKRGVEGKTKINFSYEYNMAKPFRTPELVDGYTYAQALNEGLQNDGFSPRYSDRELAAFKDGSIPSVYPNVNWWDEALRDHSNGNNAVFSVTGGGRYVKYFTQLNYLNDNGILKPTSDNDGYSTQFKYSKLNIRTNLDIELTKNTQVKLNLFGTFSEHNRPNAPVRDIFQALYTVPAGAFPIKNGRNIWAGTTDFENNPVAMISGTGYARSQRRNFYADMTLTRRLDAILQGLSASVSVGLDNSASYWDSNARKYGYEQTTYDWEKKELSFKNLRNETALSASHSVGASQNHFYFNASANYKNRWGDHALSSMLNYSMDKLTAKGQNNSYAFIDMAAQAHYSYKQRYIADVVLSGTASSILKPGHRWGVFPAFGAGWLISEESFAKCNLIDLLKLRASYGISGRADFDNDLFVDMYGKGENFFFGKAPQGASGLKVSQIGIADLTYEKSHKFNIGFDLRAFGKLSVAMDYFYDHRTDILVGAGGTVSSLFGLPVPKENAGIVDNRGFETDIHWTDFSGDLKYSVGGTFSFVRNKIIEQNEEYRPYEYLRRTNGRMGQLRGYVVEGIYQDQADIDNRKVKQTLSEVRPGDLKYKDLNNDGVIDAFDQQALGYSKFPEIYYSMDLNVEYKGFGAFALFQGIGNVSVLTNTPSVYHPLYSNRTISTEYYNNRWTPENKNAIYPRLTSKGSVNNYANNSLWVKSGAYLKLRTLELYYKFNAQQLKPLKYVSGAKVYVRGYDLLCFDGIKIMDPENMGMGHPSMTRCAIGFDLTF
ncbi:SusC/RagA family TonB-linked outer membrane protein [Hallella bergensis]|nr:SusC/RagA family TonB-linked outer membrane protein [Hallella bergensis]